VKAHPKSTKTSPGFLNRYSGRISSGILFATTSIQHCPDHRRSIPSYSNTVQLLSTRSLTTGLSLDYLINILNAALLTVLDQLITKSLPYLCLPGLLFIRSFLVEASIVRF
jgi:hypothetical protein